MPFGTNPANIFGNNYVQPNSSSDPNQSVAYNPQTDPNSPSYIGPQNVPGSAGWHAGRNVNVNNIEPDRLTVPDPNARGGFRSIPNPNAGRLIGVNPNIAGNSPLLNAPTSQPDDNSPTTQPDDNSPTSQPATQANPYLGSNPNSSSVSALDNVIRENDEGDKQVRRDYDEEQKTRLVPGARSTMGGIGEGAGEIPGDRSITSEGSKPYLPEEVAEKTKAQILSNSVLENQAQQASEKLFRDHANSETQAKYDLIKNMAAQATAEGKDPNFMNNNSIFGRIGTSLALGLGTFGTGVTAMVSKSGVRNTAFDIIKDGMDRDWEKRKLAEEENWKNIAAQTGLTQDQSAKDNYMLERMHENGLLNLEMVKNKIASVAATQKGDEAQHNAAKLNMELDAQVHDHLLNMSKNRYDFLSKRQQITAPVNPAADELKFGRSINQERLKSGKQALSAEEIHNAYSGSGGGGSGDPYENLDEKDRPLAVNLGNGNIGLALNEKSADEAKTKLGASGELIQNINTMRALAGSDLPENVAKFNNARQRVLVLAPQLAGTNGLPRGVEVDKLDSILPKSGIGATWDKLTNTQRGQIGGLEKWGHDIADSAVRTHLRLDANGNPINYNRRQNNNRIGGPRGL